MHAKPDDTARKTDYLAPLSETKPSPNDPAGWHHTMSWRPPLLEIGDRWRLSTNWLPSASNLTSPPIEPKQPLGDTK